MTYVNDQDAPATNVTKIVEAINTAAGATVAYAGSAATGAVDIDGTVPSGFTATNTLSITGDKTASIKVGMSVVNGGGEIATGARATKVSYDGTSTFVEFSGAALTADLSAGSITFGGGAGDNTSGALVAGGITLYGPEDGTSKAISFSSPAGLTTAIATSGVAGNEGTVVNFTYGGQSGQYTIGATNDATATAFAAALNAVASDATAAVVAGAGDTDHVTLTAATAGTALKTLAFANAGANAPILTTTTANGASTSVSAAAYDISGLAAESVTVSLADSANLKVSTGDDVTVSGVSGAITVDGGKDVTVTDATASKAIDLDNAKGAVTVTDTKQGTAAIGVGEGTNVSVTASERDNNTSTITVGDTATAVTGTVDIVANGKAYVAAASETFGAINVIGGTAVNVTQTATSSSAKAAADGSAGTHTFGTTTVTAGDSTTSVSVVQDAKTAAVNAVAAATEKAATQVVAFGAIDAGQTVTLTFGTNKSLTFTAVKDLTAAEVASAFANLAKDASVGSASAASGVYTNGSAAIDTGWTSGDVTVVSATAASVTFSTTKDSDTNTAGLQATAITVAATDASANALSGTNLDAVVKPATVTAGVVKATAKSGVMGVANGAVDIDGTASSKDALKTVTLENFASATIDSDVIETLNITGSAGATVVTTASKGTVTINADGIATGSQISVDGSSATVTGVVLNVSGTAVKTDLIASAATALTIDAGAAFTSEGASELNAVKTLTITGAGKVDLTTLNAGFAGTATAINASANTGGVSLLMGSDTGTFTGGAGKDSIETDSETISKAVDLGAGDDTYKLAAHSSGTSITAAFNGGDGTDSISMDVAAAQALDANSLFSDAITGFERLIINNKLTMTTADVTIDMATLGFANYVTTSGTADSDSNADNKLVLNNLANGATVVLTGTMDTSSAGISAVIKNSSTGTSDVINVVARVANDVNLGGFIAANTETVNISTEDTTPVNAATGAATINKATLLVTADKATTVNVSGAADLALDTSSSTLVTVNASELTGKLTYTADGVSTGSTVTGGSGADTLTADGSSDTLIGGAGADKLIATSLTTLTGGEGKDTFVIGGTAVTAGTYSTISDLSSGDMIDVALGVSSGTLTEGATFTAAKVSLSANATFTDYLNAAAAGTADAEAQSVAPDEVLVRWFQFNGDTFVVTDREESGGSDAAGFGASDTLIGITGLIDLSEAVFNATTGVLTI
ncbi:MAG: hemolysin-type calcium-binding region [Gammaproteobacteria bacterium]|nr:hemolysin-type calcium-binding region [Gammaproteobacteria bacterium]